MMQGKKGFKDAVNHLVGNRWIKGGDTLQGLCSSEIPKLDKGGGGVGGGRQQTS